MTEEKNKILFKNRKDASEQLIKEFSLNVTALDNIIVLATSEGGVYFAEQISQKIGCSMDIILTEPIYSDVNKQLTIAMVGETEEVIIHKALTSAFNISKDYIYGEAASKYKKNILSHIDKYRYGLELQDLSDKYVILTDECVETGLTMMSAVKTAISLGAKNIFIAVPILDNVVYENLLTICDNIFCPHKIDDYISIDYYYEELEPFGFEEIDKIMKNVMNTYKKGKIDNE